jgi:hypothetical protein
VRAIKAMGWATAAILGPFAVATTFLSGSRFLPGSFVFPAWLGAIAFGIAAGLFCLIRMTTNGWRRLLFAMAYIPVMLAATITYSLYFSGAILGEALP